MEEHNYEVYDKVVTNIFINFYNFATINNKVLALKGFNPKKEGHMLAFHVAQMASDMYGFPIQADIGFFKRIFDKRFRKVARIVYTEQVEKAYDLDTFLERICEICDFPKNRLDEIYTNYYKKG